MNQALVEALIVAAENPSQMETDDSAHDSQMRTHNESEFIGADDAHYHGNDPRDSSDSDSQSESGHSDDDDDEAEDDDDDDDDGGEEETDEEGEGEDDVEEEEEETEAEEGEEENASGYGEDSDRYPEMLRDFLTRGAAGAGADVEDTLVFTYPDAENSAAGLGFGAGLGLGMFTIHLLCVFSQLKFFLSPKCFKDAWGLACHFFWMTPSVVTCFLIRYWMKPTAMTQL